MNDMAGTIIPKSDQLNADDLLTGPITVKITGVTVRGGPEQPVSISYEGDNGKPYKPCKSMCRVMVTAWGADSKKYVGRSMTLYRDPKVKWGGMEVGGIRISHMSHIDESMTMALTVTRANKKPYTVKPLKASTKSAPAAPTQASPAPSRGPDDAPGADQNAAGQVPLNVFPESLSVIGHEGDASLVPAAPDAILDEAAATLSVCGSLQSLAVAWTKLTTDERKRLVAHKDACKDRIIASDKAAA